MGEEVMRLFQVKSDRTSRDGFVWPFGSNFIVQWDEDPWGVLRTTDKIQSSWTLAYDYPLCENFQNARFKHGEKDWYDKIKDTGF